MGHMIHVRSIASNNSSTDLAAKRPPTTPNIRDIFIGRCYEDEQCLQQDQCLNSTLNGTCEELWEIFNASFAFKDPCQAGGNTYDQLIATAPPSTMKDQFARQARGIVKVALNGSRVDAFRNTSTFATTELRNLNREYVSHVNILLVYDITIPGDNKSTKERRLSTQTLPFYTVVARPGENHLNYQPSLS
ncbi:uncharacterized protein [Asterias amurensis]|uniref:uncharacterized protein n=1 Tax=Asterias amurensis TaxID=7602 RepID=UPI003AB251C9